MSPMRWPTDCGLSAMLGLIAAAVLLLAPLALYFALSDD